jgi:phospholipid transport system substrate-binding protein
MRKGSVSLKQLCWMLPILFCTLVFAAVPVAANAGQDAQVVAVPNASEAINASDPVVLLKSLTDRLLAELQNSQAKLKADPDYIYTIVDKILLPYIDQEGMARSVLGRNARWANAPDIDRQDFIQTFNRLIVQTYAAALSSYTDQTVKYFPIRGGIQGKKMVKVDSQIIREDGPPVIITYSLIKIGAQWKVYDMSVEGIALLDSFRSQLSQGKTVREVTQQIKSHHENNTASS